MLDCRLCGSSTAVEYRYAGELKRKIVTCDACILLASKRAVGPGLSDLVGQELTEGESRKERKLRLMREKRRRHE